jgi:hypothetical protein
MTPLWIQKRVMRPLGILRRRIGFPLREDEKKIRRLKNICHGLPMAVIGNGPSMSIGVLDRLRDAGIPSCAANKIYSVFDRTQWRPTFYFCEDPILYKYVNENRHVLEFECPFSIFPINNGVGDGWINSSHYHNVFPEPGKPPVFRCEPHVLVVCGHTIATIMLQIAAYAGAARIYIFGVDMNYQPKIIENNDGSYPMAILDSKTNYFDEKMARPGELFGAPAMDKALQYLNEAAKWFKKRGIPVFNCSPNSRVESFSKMTVEDGLRDLEQCVARLTPGDRERMRALARGAHRATS